MRTIRRIVMATAEVVTVLVIICGTLVGVFYCYIYINAVLTVVLAGTSGWLPSVIIGGLIGFALSCFGAGVFFALLEIADNTKRESEDRSLVLPRDRPPPRQRTAMPMGEEWRMTQR